MLRTVRSVIYRNELALFRAQLRFPANEHGEEFFTTPLHPVLHRQLHAQSTSKFCRITNVGGLWTSLLHAGRSTEEAGATPPSDTRCVSGPCGVAPASVVQLLSRVQFAIRKACMVDLLNRA
jgi:hypothetical protein